MQNPQKKINPHYPHCYNPEVNATILRVWTEERYTKCQVESWTDVTPRRYSGTFVEYTYKTKKGKVIHVEELPLLIRWLD